MLPGSSWTSSDVNSADDTLSGDSTPAADYFKTEATLCQHDAMMRCVGVAISPVNNQRFHESDRVEERLLA